MSGRRDCGKTELGLYSHIYWSIVLTSRPQRAFSSRLKQRPVGCVCVWVCARARLHIHPDTRQANCAFIWFAMRWDVMSCRKCFLSNSWKHDLIFCFVVPNLIWRKLFKSHKNDIPGHWSTLSQWSLTVNLILLCLRWSWCWIDYWLLNNMENVWLYDNVDDKMRLQMMAESHLAGSILVCCVDLTNLACESKCTYRHTVVWAEVQFVGCGS